MALYVEPHLRGSGVGARLLRAALGTLEADGWRELSLTVLHANEPARRLYARFGFEADSGSERDERTGRPVVRLRRGLRPSG
jgi:ribosomal protein S18 acetylase RimI-like enzyme